MAGVTTTIIVSDDDWLELREGEQGLLRGRLYGNLRPGADAVVVSTHAWETIVVTIVDGYSGEEAAAGRSVTVITTRTEDGLESMSDEIVVNEEDEA